MSKIKSLCQCEFCGSYYPLSQIDFVETLNGEKAICLECGMLLDMLSDIRTE